MELAFLLALVVVGFLQVCIYNRQAGIMDEQAKISQRQTKLMESEQRPWVSLDMQPEGPLTRDINGWNFIVKYALNNVGRSPAVDVSFVAKMIPWGDPQPKPPDPPGFATGIPTKSVDALVETVCGDFLQGKTVGWGEIMFPNVPQNKRWKANTDRPIGPGFIPGFIIVGCATYRFVDDPVVHRTVRIFDLERRAYGQMIDLGPETTPMDDLYLYIHGENGSRAS